jgi:hypothetical protein
MSVNGLKKEFVTKYLAVGEQKFYRFLLVYALNKLVLIDKGDNADPVPPDLEFLEYHNRFIILYRREGEEVYLQVAKLFRKAAHRIYRIMLKKGMTVPNAKFLNLV